MESNIITLRRFLIIIFLSGFLFFTYFFTIYPDKTTKLVFCDVGQGDATYIRVKNQVDVLVDAGPDRKILNCLGKYMPFWDRKIELAIISHPQKDHFAGLLYLIDRYQIEKMLMTPLDNPSQSFKRLKEKIIEKKIKIDFPFAGEKINVLNDKIEFYWPTEEFIAKNVVSAKAGNYIDSRWSLPHTTMRGGNNKSVNGDNGDRLNVLGISTLDDNNFSLIFLFQEDDFKALFTGDATPKTLNEIVKQAHDTKNHPLFSHLSLLKIPHHGSKNGLTKKFLELANPMVAVISVGKENPYGHPAKEILDLLKAHKVKIRRTDEEGDIVFKIHEKNTKLNPEAE